MVETTLMSEAKDGRKEADFTIALTSRPFTGLIADRTFGRAHKLCVLTAPASLSHLRSSQLLNFAGEAASQNVPSDSCSLHLPSRRADERRCRMSHHLGRYHRYISAVGQATSFLGHTRMWKVAVLRGKLSVCLTLCIGLSWLSRCAGRGRVAVHMRK